MKLLLDQNLSFKLVDRLADLVPDSDQVRRLGLTRPMTAPSGSTPNAAGSCW
jgi:predicted nuclease of predicted toxin-antitoxin system